MADQYESDELYAVNQIIKILQEGSADAARGFAATYQDVMQRVDRNLEKARAEAEKDLAEQMYKLKAKHLLQEGQEQQYLEAQRAKAKTSQMQDELQIYREMSAASLAAEEQKQKNLEAQKRIIEEENQLARLQEQGRTKEARQQRQKIDRMRREAAMQEENQQYEFGQTISQKFDGLRNALADKNHSQKVAEENLRKTMEGLASAIKNMGNQINSAISTYASYQTQINARLQAVSSFSEATKALSKVAFSPLLSAEDLYSNLSSLVSQGIVSNVDQRAFFQTVKDGIAQTFDVTNASMLRMIRLQQNDSTAARLGLEAYLNRFLNVYVENTEYLTNTFDSVADSLFEASALLGQAGQTSASLEFEYVVQKWLGTLTGLGFSDSAAQSIAQAIGQLGSGEVDNNMESLMVMAANRADLSYAEMLHNGVTAEEANVLLKTIVEYLQELSGYESNIVKSQLSKIFGITVSDLIAVNNLTSESIRKIEDDLLSYGEMYGELIHQFQELPGREGIANILENAFKNFTFQTGMNIGSNPALFATWKITDLIQSVTGGINIPYISAMGSGLDLETTVENLVKLGIVGISTLSSIGDIIGGVSSVTDGSKLLNQLKISQSGATIKTMGGGGLARAGGAGRTSGSGTSQSTYVGNTDSSTYKESALNAAKEEPEQELKQKQEEYVDPVVEYYEEKLNLAQRFDSMESAMNAMTAATIDLKKTVGGEILTAIETIKSNSSGMAKNNVSSGITAPILSAIENLKAQQLGIYQSQILNTYYTGTYSDSAKSTRGINQAFANYVAAARKQPKATIAGIISPEAGTDYLDLADYLTKIEFPEKLTSIANNVDKIATKIAGTVFSNNAFEEIKGFTNLQF